MDRVRKISTPVSSLNEIPESYTLFEPCYDEKNKNRGIFIPQEHRGSIFALRSMAGDRDVYLFVELNNKTKKTLQKILDSYLNSEKEFRSKIHMGKIGSSSVLKSLQDEFEKKLRQKDKSKVSATNQNKEVNWAENLLREAQELGASDFHIESDGNRAIIRLRIHKELIDYIQITHEEAESLSNIFYGTFSRGNEEDQEQGSGKGVYLSSNLLDGEFSRNIGDDISLKARMVNIGQNYQRKFTMVLRLIDKKKSNKPESYKKMGFSKRAQESLKKLQNASRGLILFCGVTGSGKSTTQQNAVQNERDRSGNSRKIYSIEQPIEQSINRVIQINGEDSHEKVERKASEQDFSFDNLNRMLMRGDPDSIAYGEIRDNITAEAAKKGVASGHLVYGTMHVDEVMGVFSRFETFGVSRETLCRKGFIQLALFQHLIPKICPHCSIPYEPNKPIPLKFGELHAIKMFKRSDGTGIEMQKVMKIRDGLSSGQSLIRALQYEGLISAIEVAEMKMKMREMNADDDRDAFKIRLNNLIASSTLNEDEVNVRFKGDGCAHCTNGTIGVSPAAEVLVPDEKFLDMVMEGKIGKAERYWQSKLGGRSATEDTYEKILTGIVDPRTVESELNYIGE